MTTITKATLVILVAGAASACAGDVTSPGGDQLPPGSTSGGEDTTFDHDNSSDIDPWELLDRLEREGPPSFTSKVHSCHKVTYRHLGAILASRGVDLGQNGAITAGGLYGSGYNAMGGANYLNRLREKYLGSVSSDSREFDIFAAAAPEIIANIATSDACKVNGVGVQLFNGNTCTAAGLTCLLGMPAEAAHIEICNLTISKSIQNGETADAGKQLAVAAVLAATNTCE